MKDRRRRRCGTDEFRAFHPDTTIQTAGPEAPPAPDRPAVPAASNRRLQRLLAEGVLRPKLEVGVPDDAHEEEAERVAEALTRTPAPAPAPSGPAAPGEGPDPPEEAPLRRMCSRCRRRHRRGRPLDCPECEAELQRRTDGPEGGSTTALEGAAERRVRGLGPGRPLPAPTRSFFEPRLGRDLSDVRVHTGPGADRAARSVDARAFTLGTDVAFRAGEFRPGTDAGRRLLAHELTHVAQQDHSGEMDHLASKRKIRPYRPKNRNNFGAADDLEPEDLDERPFKSPGSNPWIEQITVTFTGYDSLGTVNLKGEEYKEIVPTGRLEAKYHANPAQKPSVTAEVVGGKASEGYSNEGSHKVRRIEGLGYHHTGVPKTVGGERARIVDPENPRRAFKYFRPAKAGKATMNFAVFFTYGGSSGNQAIHFGPDDVGSLACVHVPDDAKMKQINYHSVEGRTRVAIRYADSVKDLLCCARYLYEGVMVSNPCSGIDSEACTFDFSVDEPGFPFGRPARR